MLLTTYNYFKNFLISLSVPPVIKSHLKEYVVPVDQSVTLRCEAEGYPGPEISWHKDGQQITESLRRRILSSGALQIVFVQPGDAGQYTCIAANLAGSSSSGMELTVHSKWDYTETMGIITA